MPEILTPADWWSVLDTHWDDLKVTISMYLDLDAVPGEGSGVNNPDRRTLREMLPEWKAARDQDSLLRVLNAAWGMAPDRPEIHSNPAWMELCDLCSEDWVFQQLPQEDEGATDE